MADEAAGKLRHVQPLDHIVIEAERQVVKVVATVVVVRRAGLVMLVAVAVVRRIMVAVVAGAFVLLMPADRCRTMRCEHTRSQPGDEAENQEP